MLICRHQDFNHQKKKEEKAMTNENLTIIEEGTALDAQTEAFGCCWAMFVFTF